VAPALVREHAEAVQGIDMIRCARQNVAVASLSLGEPAGSMLAERRIEQFIDIVWRGWYRLIALIYTDLSNSVAASMSMNNMSAKHQVGRLQSL